VRIVKQINKILKTNPLDDRIVLKFLFNFVGMKKLRKILATIRAFGWILLFLLYIVIVGAPHVFVLLIPNGWKWGNH
jgi:hypothetical protein